LYLLEFPALVGLHRMMKWGIFYRTNRRNPHGYYKLRHLVENTFPRLKRWWRIATRHAKTLPPSWRLCGYAVSPMGQYFVTTLFKDSTSPELTACNR
jgi:hypothetical protein